MKSSGNASTPAACASPSEGGERKSINPELWYACAGPLVNLPQAGSFVVYFPQGHSEQVAATMQKSADVQIPNYPNLPWKMICLLHNVTLHADPETDEVYAQMTLQPVNTNEKEAFLASDPSTKSNRPQTEFFCKTLTASDTSTHGGFSVPRRAAEKIFPPLDFSLQPPAQELQARDLHDNVWTFRHIYRGQPKRHLLTTGWSLFVSGKRLLAGDSVLVIRDEKQQLLLGIRRANRQPTNMSSSVLSSDSMQIGILAAAAHAYANNSPFTVFYNPRASSSEFVIPLAKYNKVIYSNQISLGMRFRMMFETEESGTRRYMGTVTGISDLDPVRWKNSKWRNLQVGWDESAAGERRNRVSMWEIEPVQAPFFICPPPFFRSKRPRQPGMPEDDSMDVENLFKRAMPWLGDEICMKDPLSQNSSMPGLSLVQWMNMQNSSLANSSIQSDYLRSLTAPVLQNYATADLSKQLSLQAQILQQNNIQFNAPKPLQQIQQADQLSKLMIPPNQTGTVPFHPNQSPDINQKQMQQMAINQALPLNQNQNLLQPPMPAQNQGQQQQPQIQNSQHTQTSSQLNQSQQIPQQLLQQQILHAQQSLPQQQQEQQHQHQEPQQLLQSRMPTQLIHQANQQIHLSEQQIQLQVLQKLQQQQQQQSLLTQAMLQHPQHTPEPQKVSLDVAQHMPNISSLSQQHIAQHQSAKGTTAVMTPSQSIQHQPQQKFQPSQVVRNETNGFNLPRPYMNLPSTTGSLLSGGTQSVLTEDAPSCSTSPSSNNCSVIPQTVTNRTNCTTNIVDVSQTGVTMLGSGSFEAFPTSTNTAKDLPKPDVKPSISIPKSLNQAYLAPQSYLSNAAPMDYLDASSSATSMCVSQTDQHLQQNFTLHPSNQQTLFFRDGMQESDIPVSDPRNNVLFGVNIDIPLEIPMPGDSLLTKNVSPEKEYQHNLVSKIAIPNYNGSKEAQAEPSTSIVSQSFGVAEVAFNSIDSTINDGSLLNKCTWGPTPQIQRMRTYTKVYKRGAVGRSIDITRYSGYDELKQDLARMFSIEGQLEDRQRIGWKLVYVDHESDVLLVGDDPWEEFVSCVRCIRILSPQEEQQMSLDGDIGGNNVLPNQACSSSDGGNVWRGKCDQNNNPSAGSYGHID